MPNTQNLVKFGVFMIFRSSKPMMEIKIKITKISKFPSFFRFFHHLSSFWKFCEFLGFHEKFRFEEGLASKNRVWEGREVQYRSKYDSEWSWDMFWHATTVSRPLAIELAKLTSCRIGNFQNFDQILAIYNENPYTGDLERPGAEAGFDRFRVVEAIWELLTHFCAPQRIQTMPRGPRSRLESLGSHLGRCSTPYYSMSH